MDIQSKLIPLLRTLCITYLLSGLLLVIFSFIMYKCKLQESQMKIAIYTIYTLSCFIGGFLSGKIAKKKRFLFGLLFGGVYFILLLLLSLAINQEIVQGINHLLSILAFCGIGGMVGGMIS